MQIEKQTVSRLITLIQFAGLSLREDENIAYKDGIKLYEKKLQKISCYHHYSNDDY